MPFKDRVKQLFYMQEYSSKRTAKLLALAHDEEADTILWSKVVPRLREKLEMRRKLPISISSETEGHFIWETFKVQSLLEFNPSLERAIDSFCEQENNYLKDRTEVNMIKDVHVSLIDKDRGLIWEILYP